MRDFEKLRESIAGDEVFKSVNEVVSPDLFQPVSSEELRQRNAQFFEDLKSKGTLNSDGSYSFKGDVDLQHKQLTSFPFRFKEVGGDFSCGDNQLTSLEGAPEKVGGRFYCGHNPVSVEKLKQTVSRNYTNRM